MYYPRNWSLWSTPPIDVVQGDGLGTYHLNSATILALLKNLSIDCRISITGNNWYRFVILLCSHIDMLCFFHSLPGVSLSRASVLLKSLSRLSTLYRIHRNCTSKDQVELYTRKDIEVQISVCIVIWLCKCFHNRGA